MKYKIGDVVNYRGTARIFNPCRILNIKTDTDRHYVILTSDRYQLQVKECNVIDIGKKIEVYRPIDIYNLLIAIDQTHDDIVKGLNLKGISFSGEFMECLDHKYHTDSIDWQQLAQYLCKLLDKP